MPPLRSISGFVISTAALFLFVAVPTATPATGADVLDYQQSEPAGLSSQPSNQELAFAAGKWRLEVRTQGGIHGLGIGDISINAQGEILTRGASGECKGKLSEKGLKQVEQLVLSAKPALWKSQYVHPDNPAGCCDQIKWLLSLSWNESHGLPEPGLGRMYTSSWYDDSKPLLPIDLSSLLSAAMSGKEVALKDCRK